MTSNFSKQGQSSKQTLFAIPDPKVRHNYVYSHGHRASRRAREQSVGILSEEDDGDATTAASTTDAESETDIASGNDEDEIRSTTSASRRRSRRKKVARFGNAQATHREKHLRHIYDLLMLSISRGDGRRAYRSLRVLLHAHEWSAVELWRHALQVTTMVAAEQVGMRTEEDRVLNEQKIAKERLKFMRQINRSRASALQVDLLLEMIPEMLMLGLEEQAMEEIDLLITTYPFRLEPLLHLYSAMLYLIVSERSLEAVAQQEGRDIENDTRRIRFGPDVTLIDKEMAFIPKVLLIYRMRGHEGAISQLKRIEQKFEMVLNVGKAPSKRGRRDVRSASQSRSRSRSRSRSQSHSRSQSRNTSLGDTSNSESEAESTRSRGRRRRRRRRRSDFEEEDENDEEDNAPVLVAAAERDDVRVMNDGWARAMARAYLAIIKSPITLS
ncbi:uncharacterized protein FA14DRAFT_8020 [Meira miltonrushii]|uniref:Uncharacterized protein n=1 Tax=Meira miltonrushii TaxID=1280837 RepID=A0A316VGY8_9BASI|nr:uncharacterized protein FA14DRAFT_8020 [Meira miltonrushii]PWN36917.1 hypothetical protein FA14DRAFT_8020 [Meira miltonrushii]